MMGDDDGVGGSRKRPRDAAPDDADDAEDDDAEEKDRAWRRQVVLHLQHDVALVVEPLCLLIVDYMCTQCQYCDRMEGRPWQLRVDGQDRPPSWLWHARLCPDDFLQLDVAVCRLCGDATEADTARLFECSHCDRMVGYCCAQITYCQSNYAICRSCTQLPECTLLCDGCGANKPATEFEVIQDGACIVEDSGQFHLLCPSCREAEL